MADNFYIPPRAGTSRKSVTEGAVEKIEQQTIELLRDSLESYDAFASGELAQSIDVRSVVSDGTLTLSIYMEDYWKFVDEGVAGTQDENAPNSPYRFKTSKKSIPPNLLSGANGWIASKGISLTQIATHYKDKKGVLKKRKKTLSNIEANKSLSFAMGKSIHKKGIKPKPFFSSVIDETWIKNLTKELGKAYVEDIKNTVIEISNGNNN